MGLQVWIYVPQHSQTEVVRCTVQFGKNAPNLALARVQALTEHSATVRSDLGTKSGAIYSK